MTIARDNSRGRRYIRGARPDPPSASADHTARAGGAATTRPPNTNRKARE